MAQIIPFPSPITLNPTECAPQKIMHIGAQGWISQIVQRYRFRRMLARELLHAPDAVLWDAGWSRSAVERELAKPLWRA